MTTSPDGTGLAWTVSGEGPNLIRAGHWLTHLELDVTNAIWGPWIERMQRGRRLIRYDFRGTGMSDHDCGPMTMQSCVDDMIAVADAAGAETFSIFAASQSMAVACSVAAQHPDRVERIFSWGGWAEGSNVRDQQGLTMNAAIGQMLLQGWGNPEGGFMRSVASLFLPGATAEQMAAFVDLQIASADGARAVEIRNFIADFDVKEILKDIRCPVQVIHARQDSLHPFKQAQILARMIPDARLHMVDSINHILLPTEPAFDEMFDLLDTFLAGD